MMMGNPYSRSVPYVRVLEEPAVEPVTLAEAKAWCKVEADDTAQDAVIAMLIRAARGRAEHLTGRAYIQRRLELRLDRFPCRPDVIALPFPPLVAVEYIEYLDTGGAVVRLEGSPSAWHEDAGSTPGRIEPLPGAQWPATLEAIGAVRIGYLCGYAAGEGSPTDLAANVPASVKAWMSARITTYYDQRSQIDMSNIAALPRDFVDGLLDELRAQNLFA